MLAWFNNACRPASDCAHSLLRLPQVHAVFVMRSVGELVEGFSNLKSVLPTLTQLGKSHATRGVRPDHFDVMRDCLLESLAEVS